MIRLSRTFAGLGLALLVSNAGCHNVRDEVPPHHKFRNDAGKPDSAVEFSTTPHEAPATASGLIGSATGNAAPSGNAINSAASPGNAYGNLTSGNKFGSPGTAGLGRAPSITDPPGGAPSGYPPQPPARMESPGPVAGQPADAPSPF